MRGHPGGGGGGGGGQFSLLFIDLSLRFAVRRSSMLLSLSLELSYSLDESFARLFVERPVGGLMPIRSAVRVMRSW